MKTVTKVSLRAAKAVLKKHHIDIPDAVIEEMLEANDRPSNLYEIGDFVQFNEGMGEAGFGTITKRLGNDSWMNYRVRQFNYGAEGDMFTRDVDALDVARLATEEDAMEYYRVRNGQ